MNLIAELQLKGLIRYEVIVQAIAATATRIGRRVSASLDTNAYITGVGIRAAVKFSCVQAVACTTLMVPLSCFGKLGCRHRRAYAFCLAG
ncbi:hypothetical protein [Streptomyces mirabilis]|uniref:Uncharacterized protein n=1 Tax=Streptomyces mirabilis TaxID=68239 RepID=A0ABU3V603_9ACTN|nr:hypothetical protein [Streptomyces mirabilis]MCX5357061.1 hypothetical protein [Streptomyces mirabilis]MDU9001598.1 hypothetical protein [Streptomyces mirabilis]